MLKKIGLVAVMVAAGALPAMAQSTCTAPPAPSAVDGSKVTIDELRAGIAAVKAFIAASDTYQTCLGSDLQAQKDQAAANKKPLDPAIEQGIDAKVNDNQAQKEKAGTDINTAIGAYKKLHPG